MGAIEINAHKGEIGCEDECFHNPSYIFHDTNGDEDVWFEVNVHVIQQKTSCLLHVNKNFENELDAKLFLQKFVKENPLSEGVIIRKTSKELVYYI